MPAEVAPCVLYLPELPEPGASLLLPAEESHYLLRVVRARVGDRATATDGRGALATLVLLEDRPPGRARVESLERTAPARGAQVWCGPPAPGRSDWVVEKLAEFGVGVWQPLDWARASWSRGGARSGRWRRLAVAPLRQSRRRFLLEVREPVALGEALEGRSAGAARWLADPAGAAAGGVAPPAEGVAIGVVGPAPGLSPEESRALERAGFVPLRLADGVLRTETAALAWAAWWAAGGA